MKYTKKADNENFDIESLDNIWTVDMFMDNMDSPDGHDNVEFTKIGLIDFLNGEIEEYDNPDDLRLSQNVSNEELKEAVYDLLEGKVISIEPYHKIYGSKKGYESMKKHIYNNKNIKSYNEREAVDVLFKLEPLDKAGIDGIDVVAWFRNDPTLCYAHNGQHSTCDPEYMKNLEDAKYSDYKYLLQELDNMGYDVTVLNHDYFKGSKINKTAGWRVEKVNENDWIIHTPKGYYVDENDKEYHFSTKEKALAELDYLRAEHKYEKKAYYDEYLEDLNSPEYIYSLLLNGNIAEYKKALNNMTKKELVQYLRWADEMGIDDSKLNLHYVTASNQRIIRKAVRMPGKKYRIDINTVLDVFVGEGTDIVDYKVDNDKLKIKHDYGTKTVSLNDCEKAFGLVDGYWKYDSNGNVIGFGGTYQQEDMEEKEASCKKSAKRTMPLRLRRKIAMRRKAGESYGWVVDSADAYDALDKFVDAYGTEEALDAITRAMSNDDLSDTLAYIFREYDFKEGCSDYEEDEEYEE